MTAYKNLTKLVKSCEMVRLGGAIGAALYNLVAGWIGGIEVEFEEA